MNKLKTIENSFEHLLEDNSLEEILEWFDLTPAEALVILFGVGQIDEELLEGYTNV